VQEWEKPACSEEAVPITCCELYTSQSPICMVIDLRDHSQGDVSHGVGYIMQFGEPVAHAVIQIERQKPLTR